MTTRLYFKRLEKAIKKAINTNPQEIIIRQRGKILENGAYKNIDNEEVVIGVVYVKSTNDIKINSETKGTSKINTNYEMVVNNKITIKSDSRITTTIECSEGKLKVTYVNIYSVEGKIAGYQCGLEVID